MDTTLTPTSTFREVHDFVTAKLAADLTAHGFLVTPRGRSLDVRDPDPTVGLLGTVGFYDSPRMTPVGVRGSLELDPRHTLHRRRSVYKLDATGSVNLLGLVRRLKGEVPKIKAAIVARAAEKVRDARDEAILTGLGPLPTNATVDVWEKGVSIKLWELTPATAARVLKALSEGD